VRPVRSARPVQVGLMRAWALAAMSDAVKQTLEQTVEDVPRE